MGEPFRGGKGHGEAVQPEFGMMERNGMTVGRGNGLGIRSLGNGRKPEGGTVMDDFMIEQEPKDVEVANAISRHLRNLDVGELHVSVKGGHVTVTGRVEAFADKRRVTNLLHGFG